MCSPQLSHQLLAGNTFDVGGNMNTRIVQLTRYLSLSTCLFFVASSAANAQHDTVEFKFIPKYYPEQNSDYTEVPPPEVVFKPDIVFPSDPRLQGKEAKVYVKVLVNTNGIVRDAQVIKSTDVAFNKYALKYAKRYKFKVTDEFGKLQQVWISIPIIFKQ